MVAHTVTPSIYYSGGYVPIGGDLLQAEGIAVQLGYAEEGQLRPSKLTWRFNDLVGKYDVSNPLSPLYGITARNMLCAVALDGAVRVVCEASSMTPDQDPEFTVGPPQRGRRWVDLEAQGILRRIGQWSKPLRSSMFRWISGYANLAAYWPGEDQSKATQLGIGSKTGQPGVVTAVAFADDEGPGGSAPLLTVGAAGKMSGAFPNTMSTTSGWQVSWVVKGVASTAPYLPMMTVYASNGYMFEVAVSGTLGYRLQITDRDGAIVDTSTVGFGGGVSWTQWIGYRLKVKITGGTVDVDLGWYTQDTVWLYSWNRTFAGTLGRPLSWRVSGNANTADAAYGHIFAIPDAVTDLLGSYQLASFDGFLGERAGDRFVRLCGEEGITATVIGSTADTQLMGRQRPDTVQNLLKEIADTEDAFIYDTQVQVGLTLRTRVSRYNQGVALALTWPGHIAVSMPKVTDDLGIYNQVTASQRGGGEVTATLESGPMSVLNSPAGVGEYKRTVDVNVASEADQLALLAGWYLSRGTVPGSRYPQVTVDLDGNFALAAQVNAVRPGDIITVTGRDYDVLQLMAIGVDDTAYTHRRKVTFTCVPADIFTIGTWDSASKRLDSASTTLNAGVAAGVTALVFKTTDRNDTWALTGAGTPYDVIMGGERMTVTAMGAVSGSGPYLQTATVTRAVNGVVKAQLINEPIHVFAPFRWAL